MTLIKKSKLNTNSTRGRANHSHLKATRISSVQAVPYTRLSCCVTAFGVLQIVLVMELANLLMSAGTFSANPPKLDATLYMRGISAFHCSFSSMLAVAFLTNQTDGISCSNAIMTALAVKLLTPYKVCPSGACLSGNVRLNWGVQMDVVGHGLSASFMSSCISVVTFSKYTPEENPAYIFRIHQFSTHSLATGVSFLYSPVTPLGVFTIRKSALGFSTFLKFKVPWGPLASP
jgi:hypothetical protein